MNTVLTAAVFAAAATSTAWTPTNLGPHTDISLAGYTWTVELPAEGQGNARIIGRHGYGGTELLDITAMPAQTIGIVEAAMSALRAPIDSLEDDQRWEVEHSGEVIGVHDSESAAKAHVRYLLIGGANPQRKTVLWLCLCEGEGECPDCENGLTEQFAYTQTEGCYRYPAGYCIRPAALTAASDRSS